VYRERLKIHPMAKTGIENLPRRHRPNNKYVSTLKKPIDSLQIGD